MKFSPRIWIILGILYLCYMVYSTLLPFNFTFSLEVIQNSLGKIEWLERYGRTYFMTRNIDAIANIFFFIPLGIIIFNARYALGHNRRYTYDILLVTLAGLILSIGIESAQLLIEERKTSLIDILMNTIGCFLGAAFGYIINQFLTHSVRQKIAHFLNNLPTAILLVPFLLVNLLISENLFIHFLESEKVENIYFNWDYSFRPIWIWLVLYVDIPIGILIAREVKKRFHNFQHISFYVISFSISISIIGLVEFINYIKHTTLTPFLNLYVASFGVLSGIAFSEVVGKNRLKMSKSENRKIISVLTGIYAVIVLLILYKSAYPFNFNFSPSYIFDKTLFSLLSTYSLIPFSGFQKLFLYSVFNILLYLPIGIVLSELEPKIDYKKKVFLLVSTSILLIVIPFAVQILNQNLTPFLFEIPSNVLGIFLGYFLWFGFRSESQIN